MAKDNRCRNKRNNVIPDGSHCNLGKAWCCLQFRTKAAHAKKVHVMAADGNL